MSQSETGGEAADILEAFDAQIDQLEALPEEVQPEAWPDFASWVREEIIVPYAHLPGRVETLESEKQELRMKYRQTSQELETTTEELEATRDTLSDLVATVNDLQSRMEGEDPTNHRDASYYEDMTFLEKYAQMDEAERESTLSPSHQRAVLIYQNWGEWAEFTQAGQVITTANEGSGKAKIKVALNAAWGKSHQSIEIYRAMKQVAMLSVQDKDELEVVTDEFGREHIRGGAFEYHEKAQDDNRQKKVLKLVDEGIL